MSDETEPDHTGEPETDEPDPVTQEKPRRTKPDYQRGTAGGCLHCG